MNLMLIEMCMKLRKSENICFDTKSYKVKKDFSDRICFSRNDFVKIMILLLIIILREASSFFFTAGCSIFTNARQQGNMNELLSVIIDITK